MKNSIWIGKKGFRYWYYKYRDSEYYALGMIAITIIVSLLLLFFVIIPEVTQWFSIQDEITATQQRISVLQANITFVNNLDKNQLSTQLQTASQALPPDKNFGSVLDAIANAAYASGASLNEYSFSVGDINAVQQNASELGPSQTSILNVTVVVSGNITQISDFIKVIETSLPIADVTTVDDNDNTVSITISFYQKPFPSIDPAGDTPLAPISQEKLSLLQKLSKWGNSAVVSTNITSSDASGSSVPLFKAAQ